MSLSNVPGLLGASSIVELPRPPRQVGGSRHWNSGKDDEERARKKAEHKAERKRKTEQRRKARKK